MLTLLLGCAIGGAAVVLRASAVNLSPAKPEPFCAQSYGLVLIGVGVATVVNAPGLVVGEVEGVVGRRRSLATAVAAGVPRRVLARAVVLESALPVALAALGGVFAAAALATLALPASTDVSEARVPA